MPPPNATYGDVATTTMRGRRRKLVDNFRHQNAILYQLSKKGKIDPVGGGTNIVAELDYQENETFTRYAGAEQLNIQQSQTFTAAEYAWKQAAMAVVITGREQHINMGREQMINLLKARIRNAEKSFKNRLSADMYSDGTASGGKQIGGLKLLVDSTPATGTVGGIDAASHEFWRNFADTTALTGGANGNVEAQMRNAYVKLRRDTDFPDLILAGDDAYLHYWGSLTEDRRFVSDKDMARAGWTNLSFMNSKVALDGGIGGNCPTGAMYFLNCMYLAYNPHRNRNMVTLPKRRPVDQDAEVILTAWMGNMTCSNRKLQGIIGTV